MLLESYELRKNSETAPFLRIWIKIWYITLHLKGYDHLLNRQFLNATYYLYSYIIAIFITNMLLNNEL